MSKSKEESLGAVTRNRAVKIFEALGFKTAKLWDAPRLQKKLTKLHTLIEGADLDAKTLKRVNEILRTQSKGREVSVIDPEMAVVDKKIEKEVEAAGERESSRKAEKKAKLAKKERKENTENTQEKTEMAKKKTKKVVKKTKTKKVTKKVAVVVKKKTKTAKKKVTKKTAKKKVAKNKEIFDRFGSRKGTNRAKINDALGRKPKTMDMLKKDTGLKDSYSTHLKSLIKAGYVEKTDKGYSLTGK